MKNHLSFHADTKLSVVLARGRFTLSAEIIPPRNGAEQGKVFEQIDKLVNSGSQFLAVTKGAGGSLRGGSLPIAQVIKEKFGVPCIAHFTCRDLLPVEVENQLMDHYYFGIRNILALRGDPPDGQPMWKAKEGGGYNYAYELIEQIRKLNHGKYLSRPNDPMTQTQAPTDFCIGAAVYPEMRDEKNGIEFFKRKVEAGAEYGITDMLFDVDAYSRFMEKSHKAGVFIPVLPGTRVLKSQDQVLKMQARFKTNVPKKIFDQLPEKDSPEGVIAGVDIFLKFADDLRRAGAPGIHFFVIGDTNGACQVLRRLAGR